LLVSEAAFDAVAGDVNAWIPGWLAEFTSIYISAGLETSAIRARWLSTMSQHLIFGAPATALCFSCLDWRCGGRGIFMPRPRSGRSRGSAEA